MPEKSHERENTEGTPNPEESDKEKRVDVMVKGISDAIERWRLDHIGISDESEYAEIGPEDVNDPELQKKIREIISRDGV